MPRLGQKKMVQNNKDSVKKDDGKGETTVEPAMGNKRNSRKPRVRECLKEEPLEPLYTGKIKKPKQPKRPKFSTKKSKKPKKISKVKSPDQNPHLSSSITSRKTPVMKSKTSKSRKEKSPLPSIVVEKDDFESEVIFNPRVSCKACLAGRKGEGGNDCWSCRLTRLQNIQEEKMKSLN